MLPLPDMATFELVVTLKLIKNLGQACLFSSLFTIPVQQCRCWDGVSSAAVALFCWFQDYN